MYQVTATYGKFSATMQGAATMAEACDVQAELYRYYTVEAEHANTKVCIDLLCDSCDSGRVKKCPAPKRHANGYHGERCYRVCQTCKGEYSRRVDA
jgi:hypothetical protein